MFEFVRADINRIISSERKTLPKVGMMLLTPGLHAVLLYRLARWFFLHHMQPLAVLVGYLNSVLTGAQISHRAAIGKGLAIYHPQGTVIGATVIGSNCTLSHGNLIGQAYGDGDRPIIGDNFFAATGAKIIGAIGIGNNVRVGANAVVLNSLPDGTSVAAPSAKLILGVGSDDRIIIDRVAQSSDRDTIQQRLVPLLRGMLSLNNKVDMITKSTGLLGEGIGVDSLELLRVVAAVEEEFDITIDDTEVQLSDFQTVGSLVTFIQKQVSL